MMIQEVAIDPTSTEVAVDNGSQPTGMYAVMLLLIDLPT